MRSIFGILFTIMWVLSEAGRNNNQCARKLSKCTRDLGYMGIKDNSNYLKLPKRAEPLSYTIESGFRPDLNVWFNQIGQSNVWWMTEGAYQSAIVVGTNELAVMDCSPFFIDSLVKIVAELGKPVKHIIYSHSHDDHIGGCGKLKKSYPAAAIYATERVAASLKRFKQHGAPNETRPDPTITFSGVKNIVFPGNLIELREVVEYAHEDGEIIGYFPNAKTLMYVDVLFPFMHPFYAWAVSSNFLGYSLIWDYLLDFKNGEWEYAISGHTGKLGTKENVKEQAQLIQDTFDFMAEELGKQNFGKIAGDLWPNFLALLAKYVGVAAQQCAARLIEKYGSTLGGVDAFAFSSCWNSRNVMAIDVASFDVDISKAGQTRRALLQSSKKLKEQLTDMHRQINQAR